MFVWDATLFYYCIICRAMEELEIHPTNPLCLATYTKDFRKYLGFAPVLYALQPVKLCSFLQQKLTKLSRGCLKSWGFPPFPSVSFTASLRKILVLCNITTYHSAYIVKVATSMKFFIGYLVTNFSKISAVTSTQGGQQCTERTITTTYI